MTNKGWVFLIAVFFLLAVCPSASANSVSIYGGYAHTANSNDGDGGEYGARIEFPFARDFAVAFDGMYFSPSEHAGVGDLDGFATLGELFYYPPVDLAGFQPYIYGGAGWSWWGFERNSDMARRGIQITTGDTFAQKYGAGFQKKIGDPKNKTLDLKFWVEFSYFHADIPKDSFYESTGAFANVGGDDDRSGRVRFGYGPTSILVGIKGGF